MSTDTLRGTLLKNESLAKYTSWRVGGPAKQLYKPADQADLVRFLQSLPEDEPLLWLGLGSNTLIRDSGFAGTVILSLGALKNLAQTDDLIVRAQAGVSCASMARFCARQGLTGAEFLAGVPGTIGGALSMNAGCFGGETWQQVVKVETINHRGEVQLRDPSEFQVAYRHVVGPKDEWFVAGHFKLTPGDKETSLEKIRTLLARRTATQPTGDYSCGSVFRNPPGDHAARLIDACELKGTSIGGAQVSTKHANFIINTGEATATDIEELIELVAAKVATQHNINLIKEVKIIGQKAHANSE